VKVEAACEQLRHAFERDRLAQAYMLVGNPNHAGRDVAERTIQLLHCEEKDRPCGRCSLCKRVSEHTHPDVLWVEPQKKSRAISVEQVRGIQQRIQQTTFAGAWKACVLSGADRLTSQASNAFLKTLEEPAGRCLLLLLTDSPQSMLATILSRCQPIVLQDGGEAPDAWDRELLEILGAASPGDGDGLGPCTAGFAKAELLGALMKRMKDEAMQEVMEAVAAEATDEDTDTINARAGARYREMRSRLVRSLLLWYRDLLLLKHEGDEALVCFQDHLDMLKDRAARLSTRQAMANVRVVEDLYDRLERNLPEVPVLGYGCGRLVG